MATIIVRFWFLLVLAVLTVVHGTSIEILSSNRQDELKSVLWGGECWIIACIDMDDKDTGKTLLESSVSSLKESDSCRGAVLQCHSKLPSGKTIIQRLKLTVPPKGHPLLFMTVNGDHPRALKLKEFAKIKDSKAGGSTATPDAKVLTKHIQKASLPVKPAVVTTTDGFKTKCLNQRHCVLVITNTSANQEAGFKGSGDRAATGLAESLSSKVRSSRIVSIDVGTADFSLSSALPSIALWPKSSGSGNQDFYAPRVLYLRSLSQKESQILSSPKLPLKATISSDSNVPVVSTCSAAQLLKAANESAAWAIFESKKLSPRQWASLDGRSVKFDSFVFAIEGNYLSWGAASHWMMGSSVFGSPPSQKSLQELAIAYPLVQSAPPKWGARAFRTSPSFPLFTSKSVGDWLLSATALDLESSNDAKSNSKKKGKPNKNAVDTLAAISTMPKFSPHKVKKSKTSSSPAVSPTKKSSRNSPTSSPTKKKQYSSRTSSSDTKEESGAAKRRRRLAEKAELQERAAREAEVRRKMDMEAEDFLPSSPDDEYGENDIDEDDYSDDEDDEDNDDDEVEVDINGDTHWRRRSDDFDDDSFDFDEDSSVDEDDEIILL